MATSQYVPPPCFQSAPIPVSAVTEPTKIIELSEQELRPRILAFLTAQTTPVKTIEISRNIYGKGASSKLINPCLYTLEKQGLLVKTAKNNGGDPRWSIKR
jgi:hypothetical protein